MGIIGKTSYRSNEGRYSIYINDNNLVTNVWVIILNIYVGV